MKDPGHIVLCPLPAETINRTIQTDLETADVVLTSGAQLHASRKHPDDYAICLPHIASVIAGPLYIGDDFANDGKIELISRVAAVGGSILVAVNIDLDDDGTYHVASFYRISDAKIANRRAKGYLKNAIMT